MNSTGEASAPTTHQFREIARQSLGWLLANGQTMRWVTEQVVLREILTTADFEDFWKASPTGRSADIGCGGGRYLIELLAPRSAEVFGLEYNRSHVMLARTRIAEAGLSSRVRIDEGSAEEIPLAGESVDFALCTQVLEHLPSPARGVEEIGRILRPGGRAILSIPIPPDPCPNPEHLHPDFIPSTLDAMVKDGGLNILRKEYTMYAVSRAVARLVGFAHVPLPLNPLCWFEQATSKFIPWPRPHVYVCVIEKKA